MSDHTYFELAGTDFQSLDDATDFDELQLFAGEVIAKGLELEEALKAIAASGDGAFGACQDIKKIARVAIGTDTGCKNCDGDGCVQCEA